jgi:hypothetical protein
MPLPATLALQERCAAGQVPWETRNLYLEVIAREGSPADVPLLMGLFRSYPDGRDAVVKTISALGDETTARELSDLCIVDGKLKPEMPSEALQALGYLGYQSARDVLWRYAISNDYYPSRAACIGLLHLDLSGMEKDIEQAIQAYCDQRLFPEFLPLLAHRTGNARLLSKLYRWGEYSASTDCNGGLILGIALFGQAGLPYFKRLLWSEAWEAYASATGSGYWLEEGRRYLGLRLIDLYREFQKRQGRDPAKSQRYHDLMVLKNFLWHTCRRTKGEIRRIPPDTESYLQLYETLFVGEKQQSMLQAVDDLRRLYDEPPHQDYGLRELETLLRHLAAEELRQAQH